MESIAGNNFHECSQLAARAEKANEYEVAASLWRGAAMLAENPQNIEWALRRKLFCMKKARKQC
ncbi:ANR family transcriptional regulator [Escherichia coli]|uniref:ANR family transcriptional regulator n=1 Tax=Escherichia coli TaxID=562 RepID=UPI00111BEDAE